MAINPEMPVDLSPEEQSALEEVARAKAEDQQRRLKDLVRKLNEKRDECVKAKRPVEDRWIDDIRQYEGLTRNRGTKERPAANSDGPPRIHRTRSRTDLLEARLSDMLFTQPAWNLNPSPIPDLPEEYKRLSLEEQIAIAQQMCDAMKQEIKDSLADSRFPTIGRKMTRDACRMGTGLLMGPMMSTRTKRSFVRDIPKDANGQPILGAAPQMRVALEEEPRPEVRYGDPWCFFPEMVASADKAQYAFYLHLMSQLELKEFAKYPNVNTACVAEVLKDDPDLGAVGTNIRSRNSHLPFREETADRYAVWLYTGVLDREELEALGLVLGEEPEDVLAPTPMVHIWYCQDHILKAKVCPIDGDFRIPYYVFSPFPADDTMFGYGIPYLCRDSQRVADSAWQIMLHNASVSSGPIIFAREAAFKTKSGETYEINGPRWVWVNDPQAKLDDILHVQTIQNEAEQALMILDRALQVLDDEINMPQIMGDTLANKPLTQTASGIAMLFNQMITIVQRRAAAAFDDDVIIPLIERTYWWHMLYNPREDIKGDYIPEALGQSALLVKDIKAQQLQSYAMLMSDPRFAMYSDDYELLQELSSAMDVPRERLLLTKEAAEAKLQQNPPPPDPRIEAANIQAAVERERMQHEVALTKLKGQIDLALADSKLAEAELAAAADERMTIADVQKTLGVTEIRERNNNLRAALASEDKRFSEGLKVQTEAEKLAQKERSEDKQVRLEKPVRLA